MTTGPLRLIFMGTPDFAATILKSLLSGPDKVVAAVTQPDKAKGRGKRVTPPPVKVLAESMDIPVLQPARIKTEDFRNGLLSYRPDLLVVAAYGRILPQSLLDLAPLGAINVHGSILPKYRGAAPIQWAVINGETESGISIMQMDAGMDTGDVLLKAKIPMDAEETAGSLFNKLAPLGGETVLKTIKGIKEGSLIPVPQDHSHATAAPMLKKDDGLVDWTGEAITVDRFIRGMDPWPSAYCFQGEARLRLFRPQVCETTGGNQPGCVLRADRQGILVACGNGAVLIREIQPEGGKRMAVEAYLCGHPLAVGTIFGR